MANSQAFDRASSPFHAGERALQERAGVREQVERGGRRMILDHLSEEHRDFFAQLPFLVVGSVDDRGRPWASLLSAEPGFVTAPTPHSLIVGKRPLAADPLSENLRVGAPLGILGIQLETRRRNRANGRIVWENANGFELSVEQAFGNCRRYIQARTSGGQAARTASAEPPVMGGGLLSEPARTLLEQCDTSFLASASAEASRGGREGVDVSHRGGRPGFLHIEADSAGAEERTRLVLPDYQGNFLFNTLGNIAVNPRVGLLACDFSTGDLLSLTGDARIVWDGPRVRAFAGAERLLEIDVQAHIVLPGALGKTWSAPTFARELG